MPLVTDPQPLSAAVRDYSLFGLRLRSSIPLPELFEAAEAGEPDVVIALGAVAPPPADAQAVWGLTRSAGGVTLTVESVGRYAIEGGARIVADPLPGASARNIRLFLLGSAFGALLHQRGVLPIHGNAVLLGDGAAAFTGRSGAGKSTLAAHFLDRGLTLLADDVCAVTFDAGGQPLAQPGIPRLRLWRDAVEASGRDASGFDQAFDGEEKFVVPTHAGHGHRAVPLRRIYLLGRLPDGVPGPVIRRLSGVEALSGVMENVYRGQYLPLLGGTGRNLQQCLALARAVPVFELQRQWGYEAMDAQIRAIEAHAREAAG